MGLKEKEGLHSFGDFNSQEPHSFFNDKPCEEGQFQPQQHGIFIFFFQNRDLLVELIVFFGKFVNIIGDCRWAVIITCLVDYRRELVKEF